jgi:hypothetical protein
MEPGRQWRTDAQMPAESGTCAAMRRSHWQEDHPEEDMMKTFPLLSTVAASLLLTAGVASAQNERKMPERAPAAQQSAPAEKIAPPMSAGERKAPETTGQATKELKTDQKELKASDDAKSATTGQDQKSDSGKAQRDDKSSSDVKSRGEVKTESRDSTDVKAKTETKTETKSGTAETKSGTAEKSSESTRDKSTTSGQGAAGGAAKLSVEQRTKITTVIKRQKVERVSPAKLKISIRVGERVPSHVHFYPLPVEVVEIYPEWRGYLFILVGDQIIIVSPSRHEIVAVLTA